MDHPPAGDFEYLFLRHYAAVLRVVRGIVGDGTAADDVTQETFLRLYRSPPPDMTNIRAWLFRVAANLAANHLRSERRRAHREAAQTARTGPWEGAEDVADSVLRRDETSRVQAALAKLSARDRACLWLRYSGASYAEIAAALGIKRNAVGTVLARARARFKNLYIGEGGSKDVLQRGKPSGVP
ncbi:MAG: RNA polymerase sigma factor SigX [Bacillota bacterium]